MVSASELLVKLRNVVKECKILVHSTQKGSGRLILSMVGLHGYKHRRRMRQNLTYPLVIYVENGKPVYLLSCKNDR